MVSSRHSTVLSRCGVSSALLSVDFQSDQGGRNGSAGSLGQIDNLTRLRSRNHTLEVCVFAAFDPPFLAFCRTLGATLLLLLLFLSAGTFSLAFIHAFRLR